MSDLLRKIWKEETIRLGTATISIAIGFIVVKNLPIVRVILVCVWLGLMLMLYFCLGVKTKS